MPTPHAPNTDPIPRTHESVPPRTEGAGAPPAPLTAADRLGLIVTSPGPYTSVYLQTRPLQRGGADDTDQRWSRMRTALADEGAPDAALAAIDARLVLPVADETAAVGIVAAADGRTVVDRALEPPRADHGVVDRLPYAAPMLEWEQRRVPHVVVVVDGDGADIVTFAPTGQTDMVTLDGPESTRAEQIAEVASRAAVIDARLIVVGGAPGIARSFADDLVPRVAPRRNVVVEPGDTADELAEATVRHVSNVVATETVGFLRDLRFLASHDEGAQGAESTLAALRDGLDGVLLIHDDPDDRRRVWIGPRPTDLSLDPVAGWDDHGRLVDAAIFAALSTDTRIHIIPSTGPDGPTDGAALLPRSFPTRQPA